MALKRTEEWTLATPPDAARQLVAEALWELGTKLNDDGEPRIAGKVPTSYRKNRPSAKVVIELQADEAGTRAVVTLDMAGKHERLFNEIVGGLGSEALLERFVPEGQPGTSVREQFRAEQERRNAHSVGREQATKEAIARGEPRSLRERAGDSMAREARTLRLGRVKVVDGQVFTPSGNGPLAGAQAVLDSAGDIDRRVTATRLILTGPLAFGLRKKKDSRELFLLIEGDGFAHVEPADPKKREATLKFVAEFNKLAAAERRTSNPAPTSPDQGENPPADPTEQLQRLAALRDSGALSEEEFAAAKSRVLGLL